MFALKFGDHSGYLQHGETQKLAEPYANSRNAKRGAKDAPGKADGAGLTSEGAELKSAWQGSVPIPISMFCCALGDRLVPTLLL